MIPTSLYATYADIRTSDTSRAPRGTPSSAYRTLPYHNRLKDDVRRFGGWLEPRYIFGALQLDQ